MKSILVLIYLLSLSFPSKAEKRSHKAHVHGEGKFTLAVEGKNLEIEMEIPADDIVGFEHKAKTAKQKKVVQMAESQLKKVTEMVFLPTKAKCKSTAVKVKSSLKEHEEEHHHHHEEGHKEEEGHSEFHITYKFHCDEPKFLSQVTLNLFKSFPSLKELSGQAVTMDGQFAKELTPSQNSFKLYK